MVIASTRTSGSREETGNKLRRSRRLSSTRGLALKDIGNSDNREGPSLPRQDLNQKLGLCPIVSKNVDDREKIGSKGSSVIDWEVNERISLSSGSSAGIEVRTDTKNGIEISSPRSRNLMEPSGGRGVSETRNPSTRNKVCLRNGSKPVLELMNVSGFSGAEQKMHSSKLMESRAREAYMDDAEVVREDENVLKSDSKYEIGILAETSRKKSKQRRESVMGTIKSQKSKTPMKSGDKMAAPVGDRRWTAAKAKVDKTNDSISKRLELIHELNQKILANYEKFQQRSKRSHSKGSKDSKESLKGSSRTAETGNGRSPLPDFERIYDNHDHLYTEIVSKRKTKSSDNCKLQLRTKHDDPGLRQGNLDSNKFTFSKDYCERLVSSKDRPTSLQKRTKTPKPYQDLNENFSLAAKPTFHNQDIPNRPESTSSRITSSIFYLEQESRILQSNKDELEDRQMSCRSSITKKDTEHSCTRDKYDEVNQESPGGELKKQKILENQILADLNETILKFEKKSSDSPTDDSSETTDKSQSFSTDSIQSSPRKSPEKRKDPSLMETFNSSWDSGVGVEVGSGSGWVRIHTGIESSLVYLTLDTTSKDVCRDMLLGEELAIFVQYGGEPGRRLSMQEKPLELQDEFLQRLGYLEASRRARLGVDPELRHLIAFHVGPASPLPELLGYSRCGYALVLKGLVFPQWKRRPLAVIGSRLLLYPATPNSRPEWMELGGGGGAVCYAPSRIGKLVLRVTGFPRITQQTSQTDEYRIDAHHQETRHLYLGFHHPWDRDLWRGWLKQATQLNACPRRLDLSKGGLSRIPDSVVAFPVIEEIFLGQNQLANHDSNLGILQRFPRLSAVKLQANALRVVPRELLELRQLTSLDLSDNNIEELSGEIIRLGSLKELILDRNGLKDVPDEVGQLKHLRYISLAGNQLSALPSFLDMRALALTEVHPRSDHGKSNRRDDRNSYQNLQRVNLRNNQLKGSIILGNYGNLTHLDVSENNIERLDVGALEELQSVRCARNILTELTLCGKNLVSLIAGNNKLKKLIIEPIPTNLEHLDISYNALDALPEWTPDLPVLRALFASHNALTALPDRLLSQPSRLEVLHLPHNRLQALPPPRRPLNVVHLTLQGNSLTALPMSFFAYTERLKVLNLSNNRLSELPCNDESTKATIGEGTPCLEKLYLTGNCLTDTALDALARLKDLRVLHIAYNTLDTLPESCIASWNDLEELILSGNRLQYLPDNVANLQHLRVLRVHSNRLLTCPTFSKTTSLRILDLAHNQLDRVNLSTLVPPQLQFLDISCNSRLHVDPRQFQVYRSQRPVSLVDVSGQNRSSLPSHPHQQDIVSTERGMEQPWRLGFSETGGGREKLYVSQIRMPAFCNVEGLFGIFDGGSNQEAPSALQEMIPRILLEERTVRETSKDYIKYTLLSAHRELKEKGQKYGIDATLIHITRIPSPQGYPQTSRRYSLKVASSGEAKAVLCRAAGPLVLAPPKKVNSKNQLGNAAMFPLVVPDPVSEEVFLEDDDEFVIIANRRLWEVLSVQEAVREARAEASPVLAAKRLQDLAQAYGAEDNLSVMVLRLTGPGPGDLDQLMRELRHAVGKNRNQVENSCSCPCCQPPTPHKPPAPCCCHIGEGYYLNGVLKNIVNSFENCQQVRQSPQRFRKVL
ncbi:PH domain leucine-rich repeat-containing protein phosphatase 2 isoform X2 [Cephus cinctus]|uniref:PH domain leucine-rich repeat-containing protein phosphatase 2 isoform X2 n=1 Tax=Cephus cinctus TaxID=211228 RepID=A0AAJ7W7F3_CEPCN|nr:PH domain leucine-rich repeat-containing protein phosphatase 2 isoform X2 [Cephus cinctus]